MAASVEILTAIRELTSSKQIDRTELHGLLPVSYTHLTLPTNREV